MATLREVLSSDLGITQVATGDSIKIGTATNYTEFEPGEQVIHAIK